MTIATDPQYEKSRNEHFDIVLIKTTVSEFTAKPEDYKRVAVEAADPLQAMMSDASDVKGYRKMFAAKPGVMTEPEIMARRRALDAEGNTHAGI